MSADDNLIDKQAASTIIAFLKNNVPKNDIPDVESELKKDFVLAKKKRRNIKKPSKKKTQCLTRREKKDLGFYSMGRDNVKYKDILPMHQLWIEYINKVVDLTKVPSKTDRNWDSFTQSFYKADFHGAILSVIRSKCPSYVGKTGICIVDTRQTFVIVSDNDKTTTLLKKTCVFKLQINELNIVLFGKHLCIRPAERSTKKIKSIQHPDL